MAHWLWSFCKTVFFLSSTMNTVLFALNQFSGRHFIKKRKVISFLKFVYDVAIRPYRTEPCPPVFSNDNSITGFFFFFSIYSAASVYNVNHAVLQHKTRKKIYIHSYLYIYIFKRLKIRVNSTIRGEVILLIKLGNDVIKRSGASFINFRPKTPERANIVKRRSVLIKKY